MKSKGIEYRILKNNKGNFKAEIKSKGFMSFYQWSPIYEHTNYGEHHSYSLRSSPILLSLTGTLTTSFRYETKVNIAKFDSCKKAKKIAIDVIANRIPYQWTECKC